MNWNTPQQPMMQRPYMPQQNNGIIWVQGIEGAKAYQIPPNSNILLMDSESERFYIKSTDNIGMATFRIFDYTEVKQTPVTQNTDMSNYVTRQELEEVISRFNKGGMRDESIISATDDNIKSNNKSSKNVKEQ